MKTLLWQLAVALAPLGLPAPAAALEVVTQGRWAGLDVTISAPERASPHATFELAFLMDAGQLAPGDPVVFLTLVTLDNTVGLGGATWSYRFASEAPAAPLTRSGRVGDSNALLSPAGAGRSAIRLIDPAAWHPLFNPGGFSFVAGRTRDSVRWTLGGLVFGSDTRVGLTLDDDGILGVPPFNASREVLALSSPVTEPAQAALMLGGLALLAWRRLAAPGPGALRRADARAAAGPSGPTRTGA